MPKRLFHGLEAIFKNLVDTKAGATGQVCYWSDTVRPSTIQPSLLAGAARDGPDLMDPVGDHGFGLQKAEERRIDSIGETHVVTFR